MRKQQIKVRCVDLDTAYRRNLAVATMRADGRLPVRATPSAHPMASTTRRAGGLWSAWARLCS